MRKGLVAIVVSFALIALGCATEMVPVSDTNDSPVRVSIMVGDTVRVLTKHGDRLTFRVTEINEDALAGDDESVRYDDMAFVEKRTKRKLGAEERLAAGAFLVVIAGAVMGSALEIAVGPVFGTMQSVFNAVSVSRRAAKYIEAAAAAGSRMEQLLEYKEGDDCPSGPTAIPDLTDTQVLNELRNLESQLESAEVNGKDYIAARRALLDNLRP